MCARGARVCQGFGHSEDIASISTFTSSDPNVTLTKIILDPDKTSNRNVTLIFLIAFHLFPERYVIYDFVFLEPERILRTQSRICLVFTP